MKRLYDYIENYITSTMPRFKTIQPYNRQEISLENLNQMSILYPAIFIEFVVDAVQPLSLGIKNMDLTIRFRFMFENYTFTRLADMEDVDEFSATMERLRGDESDSVQFTSLEESLRSQDDDHDMINMPYIEFKTLYRNVSAYKRNNILVNPVETNITGEKWQDQ